MQPSSLFANKKSMIIEIVVVCIVLAGMYYGYTLFSTESPTTTVSANTNLLGPNLTLLIKAVNEDHLVLQNTSFLDTELVRRLEDFSENIGSTTSRGRSDPFVPYR